jgi:nucleotide-binding universal stress UspA family protein
MKNKIIVPTDFTGAANQAIRQALVIAKRAGSCVTLFHVSDGKSPSAAEVKKRLKREAERISLEGGVMCEALILEGNVVDMIVQTVCEKDYDLMVIGTHGASGIRQKLFGADILKLVARVPVPVLVVQEDSPLAVTFDKIVVPVSSHHHFREAVGVILLIAGLFDVEVHLYSIHKPGFEWTPQMLTNIEEVTVEFEKRGIRMVRIKEEQNDSSLGYARQTLRYAQTIGAEAIWMISVASEEHYYMAKAYKEAMLLNEYRIPVLCDGGGVDA